MSRRKSLSEAVGFGFGMLVLIGISLGPFIKHILWCLERADESMAAIALLIIGLFFFPIGWLHGVSLFLGFTWL